MNKFFISKLKKHLVAHVFFATLLMASVVEAQTINSGGTPSIDTMFSFLLTAIDQPLRKLLGIICFIVGIAIFINGLLRIPKHSGRGSEHISVPGTIMSLVIGSGLISLPFYLEVFSQSLFGTTSYSYVALGSNASASPSYTIASQVIKTVLRFVQLFGLMWFISAWFNLLHASDGKQGKTIKGGVFRLLGATLCWNIIGLIGYIQNTLKITILDIS